MNFLNRCFAFNQQHQNESVVEFCQDHDDFLSKFQHFAISNQFVKATQVMNAIVRRNMIKNNVQGVQTLSEKRKLLILPT